MLKSKQTQEEATPRAIPRRGYCIPDFCQIYGICRSKVYEEIRAGRLKARKIGRRTIIATEDAEAWFASLERVKAA